MARRLAIVALLVLSACAQDVGRSLDEPRVVAMWADPPAVVPPAAATVTVKLFDPEFRRPAIQWYLSINPPRSDLTVLNQDLSNPETIDDPDEQLLYLGSGTKVSSLIPEIPPEQLPQEGIFDTFPIYVLASIKIGDTEFKAFKQVRAVIPDLVERVLARQLEDDGEDRAPTASEVEAAIQARLNRNPDIGDVRFELAPAEGEYSNAMINDLLPRREAETTPLPFASGVGADQGLRFLPQIADPDLDDNPDPGEPGFNKIEIDVLSTAGRFYPLDLTTYDWVPFDFKMGGLFSSAKREGGPHQLVTVQATVYDRQGGVDNLGFEIDNGEPPRSAHQGAAGSALIAEGRRMQWVRINDPDILTAATAVTSGIWMLDTDYQAVAPHGMVMTAAAFTAATSAPTGFLERLDHQPGLRHDLDGGRQLLRSRIVRTWQP